MFIGKRLNNYLIHLISIATRICHLFDDSRFEPATVQRYAPFCMWDEVRDAFLKRGHCETGHMPKRRSLIRSNPTGCSNDSRLLR